MRPKCAKHSCNISQRNSTHAQAACNDVALRVTRTCRLLCLPTSSPRCAVQMSVVSLFSVPCSRRCYSLYSNAVLNSGLHTIRTPAYANTNAICMHTATAAWTMPRAQCPKHIRLNSKEESHAQPHNALPDRHCNITRVANPQGMSTSYERRACPCRHVTTKGQHAVRVQVSHTNHCSGKGPRRDEQRTEQGTSSRQQSVLQARLLQWLRPASIQCLMRNCRSPRPLQQHTKWSQSNVPIRRATGCCASVDGMHTAAAEFEQRTATAQCTYRPWHNRINNSHQKHTRLQHTMVCSGSTAAGQAFLHRASIQHTHSNAMHITST